MLPRYGIFTEKSGKNSCVHKRGMPISCNERNPPQRYFYWMFIWSQIRYLSSTNITIIPAGWPKKKSGLQRERKSVTGRREVSHGMVPAQTCDENVTIVTKFPFWGGLFGGKCDWGWAAPAKKNEASIFFPPPKIKGARGHNECWNATRIIMDMDHKPARKSGR